MKYRTSRYRNTPRYREGTQSIIGTRPLVKFTSSGRDDFHTVLEGERLDLIAWRYYQDCSLWWVIAENNNILNPLRLVPGKRLRIPSYGEVLKRVVN